MVRHCIPQYRASHGKCAVKKGLVSCRAGLAFRRDNCQVSKPSPGDESNINFNPYEVSKLKIFCDFGY